MKQWLNAWFSFGICTVPVGGFSGCHWFFVRGYTLSIPILEFPLIQGGATTNIAKLLYNLLKDAFFWGDVTGQQKTMDWFKGNYRTAPFIYWEHLWFPVTFSPTNQSNRPTTCSSWDPHRPQSLAPTTTIRAFTGILVSLSLAQLETPKSYRKRRRFEKQIFVLNLGITY